MTHILRVAASLIVCAGLALVPAKAEAQATGSLSGFWSASIVSPEGEVPVSMVLFEEDGRLTGIVSGPRGQAAIEGTRTPEAVTIKFSITHEGTPLPIVMTAPSADDALAGPVDYGGMASGTWKATRTAPTGVNGAWAFVADDGDGPIPGALTLLEESGKVSGRLVVRSRGVDGLVSGTLLEGILALKVDATADGSPITIDLPGKVDGPTSLAGTYAVADLTGRWTATRK